MEVSREMNAKKLRIAAVVNDLSTNCLVRTYPIVRVLERTHQVEVIGLVGREGIFPPYREEMVYRPFLPGRSLVSRTRSLLDLVRSIDADVIYAFKPVCTSYGLALLSRLRKRRPIILDIEDWDNEPFESMAWPGKLTHIVRNMARPNGFYNWFTESLHGLAEQKTVATNFLFRRYGGVKLPHGANQQIFNPQRYNREAVRKDLGVTGKKVIMFAGMIRSHKGMIDLLDAVDRLGREDVVLALVGSRTPELEEILARGEKKITYFGSKPHRRMPEVWLAADLVVLPQKNTRFAQAQIPGKIFEAMAMARPIIATAVSDLPEILEGCGWVIPPDNPDALSAAIEKAFSDPVDAEELGHRARQRFLDRYSWDVMQGILDGVFRPLT